MRFFTVIFKKELKNIIRDKSFIIISLISLTVFPILSIGLNYINVDKSNIINVGIDCNIENDSYNIIKNYIKNETDINLINSKNMYEMLKSSEIDSIIQFSKDKINIIPEYHSFRSIMKSAKLGELITNYYIKTTGIANNNISFIQLADKTGKTVEMKTAIADIMFPVLLMIGIFQFTTNYCVSIFSEENEQRTIELLLSSVQNRKHLYFGKIVTVFILSLINECLMILSFFLFNDTSSVIFKYFSANSLIMIIVCLIVFIMFAITFYTLISLLSKSVRKSQLFIELSSLLFLCISVMITSDIVKFPDKFICFPLIGMLTEFKNCIIFNDVNMINCIVSALSTVICVCTIQYLSIRYLKSEKILR